MWVMGLIFYNFEYLTDYYKNFTGITITDNRITIDETVCEFPDDIAVKGQCILQYKDGVIEYSIKQ